MAQAFSNIRILDFSAVLSAPVAVMQLGLLGAEIIKIEQPNVGDQMRGIMNEGPDQTMSPSFLGMNVNKKSITLNLRTPEAMEIIKALLVTSDVVVENFKAGTMASYGLSYDDVKSIKPDIVYCSVSGYGQEGPLAGSAAYDGAIQAASGMMWQNGFPETGPTRTGFMGVDMATGINTAFAIAASLHRRAVTGDGQYIDVAMMDTAILMLATQYNNFFIQGSTEKLIGNSSQTGRPTADVFQTQDGFVMITVISQSQVEKLFTALDASEVLQQPEFQTEEARFQNADTVKQFLADKFMTNMTDHWIKRGIAARVPIAEVRRIFEAVQDPQFETREVFETMKSPVNADETITVVKSGYKTNKDGPEVRFPAPHVGEHTDEILSDLGYDTKAIAQLRIEGVV
jgi:crotonobetainyl-CoA:carnitine CoA-transferase CaiB-like acyl-CoA transferase